MNKPTGDAATRAAVNEYIFDVTYAAGGDVPEEKATVSLAHPPAGDEAGWEREVVARASHLPESSIEQVFLSGEGYPDGKSRYFSVRTTEKEPELVQVMLDRLLRDKTGKGILATADMTVAANGPRAELAFTAPTSPNYVRRLLARGFQLEGAEAEFGGTTFDLTGAGEATDGRYTKMTLDVSKNPKFEALAAREKATAERAARQAALAASAPLVGGLAYAATEAAGGGDDAAAAGQQAATLANVLTATERAFESRPPAERLETFDSQLAAETRTKAFYAILASWAVILLFLWFRFGNWTFGLAAVLCLVHDLCFTLGAVAASHYVYDTWFGQMLGLSDFKIDLPAVAALLTLVGYSVNDTIVVFDRIREVRGKNPRLTTQIINDSINQTLSRTVLASLTVFLVVGVLYAFGGEGVHLFSFVMVVGVLVGTYSSIYVASPLLLMLGEGREPVSRFTPPPAKTTTGAAV